MRGCVTYFRRNANTAARNDGQRGEPIRPFVGHAVARTDAGWRAVYARELLREARRCQRAAQHLASLGI